MVTVVHGDKGGVGKSVVAIARGEYGLARGKTVCVVDADLRNSDVYRYFAAIEGVEAHRIDLRSEAGWIEFYDLLEVCDCDEIVVSLPGNIGSHVGEHAENMVYALSEAQRDGQIYFVLNREPDSINLLREAMAAYGGNMPIAALCNTYFGTNFSLWDASKTRAALLAAGGKETRFPDLGELVGKTLKAAPPTRIIGGPQTSLGVRVMIRHFANAAASAFEAIEAVAAQ